MGILVEIGPGELFDRLTILEIKLERISAPGKLANIRHEYDLLVAARDANIVDVAAIQGIIDQLKTANERIWELEDLARAREKEGRFDKTYMEETRYIHLFNDQRAALKRQINDALKSSVIEEKSYT